MLTHSKGGPLASLVEDAAATYTINQLNGSGTRLTDYANKEGFHFLAAAYRPYGHGRVWYIPQRIGHQDFNVVFSFEEAYAGMYKLHDLYIETTAWPFHDSWNIVWSADAAHECFDLVPVSLFYYINPFLSALCGKPNIEWCSDLPQHERYLNVFD